MSTDQLETTYLAVESNGEKPLQLKKVLDRLVGIATRSPEHTTLPPELEAEILIEELKAVSDPFSQLEYAVELHQELPEDTVEAELDPLIDTMSQDTLEYLLNQEAEAAKASYGIALGITKALTCLHAWDIHRTDETEELARFVAKHASGNDKTAISATYFAAFTHAKEQEISFDDALDAVNQQAFDALESSGHQYTYPYLYDREVSALGDIKYRYTTHPRDVAAA